MSRTLLFEPCTHHPRNAAIDRCFDCEKPICVLCKQWRTYGDNVFPACGCSWDDDATTKKNEKKAADAINEENKKKETPEKEASGCNIQ